MDYSVLPSDAEMHNRTKWSNGLHIFIDDDAGAPSLYAFDRAGKPVFSAMIQIRGANRIRIYDFAASADGGIWASGWAMSGSGRQRYFLARIDHDGQTARIIETTPYWPTQLAVAPDGTVWTIGREAAYDAQGKWSGADPSKDVLRHFDESGKLIGSAVPYGTVGLVRAFTGYLVATQDRIGWYSPTKGAGAYVEFSPDMKVIHSYPMPSSAVGHSATWGFALTPSGNAFVVIAHPKGENVAPVLYELNRTTQTWVAVEGIPTAPSGGFPMLEGNDGESLILRGPPDKSKLQVVDVAHTRAQ